MSWEITDVNVLEDAIFQLKLKIARQIGVRKGMTVIDLGSGQGGFTAAVAKLVGENGRVLAVDATREYMDEFTRRLERYEVKNRVVFIQADGTDLEGFVSNDFADMVVSYRLLEELKRPSYMPKVIMEMTRVVVKGGKVCLTEMGTVARNEAEEAYIRLHEESGDCFFKRGEVAATMRKCGLKKIRIEKVDTSVWFSPQLARQDLGFAQVWSDSDAERSLGTLIDKYGMKYPEFQIFSGQKSAID